MFNLKITFGFSGYFDFLSLMRSTMIIFDIRFRDSVVLVSDSFIPYCNLSCPQSMSIADWSAISLSVSFFNDKFNEGTALGFNNFLSKIKSFFFTKLIHEIISETLLYLFLCNHPYQSAWSKPCPFL